MTKLGYGGTASASYLFALGDQKIIILCAKTFSLDIFKATRLRSIC